MDNQEIYYRRNFYDLFWDAVRLGRMAQEVQEDDDTEFSCARASIMSSVFSLECASNCCVEIMPSGSGFKKDVDKLPFLSKFEVFLGVMFPGKTLDRGRHEVQLVQELKTIRDSFTHPKVKRTKLIRVDSNCEFKEGAGYISNIFGTGPTRSYDFGCTQFLNLPNTITWQAEDAISVLHAATKFLNYFFVGLCSYDSDTINDILRSSGEISIPSKISYGRLDDPELKRAMDRWKLNLDFLGG
ncbi:hypothetical protein M1B72_12660 [Geomonas paludis]|uniref:Uncharacterized protein n=1 Tax=Geomonas paludis TaxID=2740185 RepID=A0A6V8MXN3_9BACT|nr:hypothetical protein [Geomonas paludis]UPU34301.1 hypothetical protein M1B72_12660 [Geomonas paludis]GFO64283.1 hypothetical protein GMPD_22020 [Geomonas paludis]